MRYCTDVTVRIGSDPFAPKVVLSKVDGEKRTGENPQNKLGEKLGERLGEKLGERRNKILQVLKADSTVAIPAIATIIGVSETAIEKNLSWLRGNGYIRRIGGARGGHWEVLKH